MSLVPKLFLIVSCCCIVGALGTEALVRQSSADFVTAFNQKDTETLGTFYKSNGVLKLPDAPAVGGRENIVAAWTGGFAAGLDTFVT